MDSKKLKKKVVTEEFDYDDVDHEVAAEGSDFDRLIAGLKMTEDNIKILHHNLVGGNWFGDHEILGEWYDEVGEIEDDVIEIAMSLGHKDMSTADAVKFCPAIEVKEYENAEAFEIVKTHFEKLMRGFEALKDQVPGDVYSKFEEYIYYFRKEVNYKIAQRLK